MIIKKWISLLLFLLVICIITLNATALFIYILSKVYLYMIESKSFEIQTSELLRILKATSFGGFILGCGCWWIYYRQENR